MADARSEGEVQRTPLRTDEGKTGAEHFLITQGDPSGNARRKEEALPVAEAKKILGVPGNVALTTDGEEELGDPVKAALASQWPEAALYPRYDVIVVDGDSRSTWSGVGDWPARLALIKPFDQATIDSVAVSGAQAFERLAAFDTDVAPLAPEAGQRGLYVLYIGVNDMFQIGGANYAVVRDVYETIKTMWIKARDLGFDVCAVTLQDAGHTGTGIAFREERGELLNRMILAGSDHYDFVLPLHELIPDHTVFNLDELHLAEAGRQFIAEAMARLLGASDRTENAPVAGQTLSEIEFFALPAALNAGRMMWEPYNLALAAESVAAGGAVDARLGFKRLTSPAASGGEASIRMGWPMLTTANQIRWATARRYRGCVIDFQRTVLNEGHVFRVTIGNNSAAFNVPGFGFEFRRLGAAYEMRTVAIDGGLVAVNSAWVTIPNINNFQIVMFAKGAEITLLWTASNGNNPYEVWQVITGTGAPVSGGGGGNVCVALLATDDPPGASSAIDVRSIRPFESDTLPLSPTKSLYH